MRKTIETDILIIGSGPAGGAASLLLSNYGIDNIVVTRFGWTSQTPRAHITNQRTMEVMRDIGVEHEVTEQASPQSFMANNVFCESLMSDELGRINAWGNHPARLADYTLASPSEMCDLPQYLMEPILVSNAAKRGAKIRFNTEFISLDQDVEGVTAVARDALTGETYNIHSKYLIGADGGNSLVAEQANLPMAGEMGIAGSMNIVFEADLTQYVAHRPSILYCVIQPGANIGGVGMGILRMVRPWHKWMIVWGYDLADGPPDMDDDYAISIARSLVGDPDLEVKIESTSLWTVNNRWAERLSEGRVFCVGDAIHRHPPTNGLGSNTSIQDSFNLAWKLAHVLKGWSNASLLDTYTEERAPVAKQIVARAIQSIQEYDVIFQALGFHDANSPEEMKQNMDALKNTGNEAVEQRQALRTAIELQNNEFNAHGVEMNQRYQSQAIDIVEGKEHFRRDVELYHQATTRPGAKIPHVWLGRNNHKISTLDVVGKGQFTVLTGVGGEAWLAAAAAWSKAQNIPLRTIGIGPGLDFSDMFGDWFNHSEIDEAGCLLVRPDGHIAWRHSQTSTSDGYEITSALAQFIQMKTT